VLGYERTWSLTPRQLSAHSELRSWEIRRERAARVRDFRIAQHGDGKAYEAYLRAIEENPA
jgi:hypothetical protein